LAGTFWLVIGRLLVKTQNTIGGAIRLETNPPPPEIVRAMPVAVLRPTRGDACLLVGQTVPGFFLVCHIFLSTLMIPWSKLGL
jgi:hypothetical protein